MNYKTHYAGSFCPTTAPGISALFAYKFLEQKIEVFHSHYPVNALKILISLSYLVKCCYMIRAVSNKEQNMVQNMVHGTWYKIVYYQHQQAYNW